MGKERLSDDDVKEGGKSSKDNLDDEKFEEEDGSSGVLDDTTIPKSVYFIIGNEFCERFSFYGMKAVLYLYLTQYLQFKDEPANIIFHAFVMFAYFTTVFGAILADSYLGKFKTIFVLSIVYCIGNIILSVTSFPGLTGTPPHWWGMALGLFLLSVGTGGIKPCVSSFGGDQFSRNQVSGRSRFFNLFYFSINAGSLLSMFITPSIRQNVQCFGSQCFPLAFGIPAVLMIVATAVFVMGYKFYRHVPLGENVIVKVAAVTWTAIVERRRAIALHQEIPDHWLLYAGNKYPRPVLEDIRKVFGVLKIFLPISFFWMVYDQQGSTWTKQATSMQYRIDVGDHGGITIPPDAMQVVNTIFILLMIPLFERFIYPWFKRIGYELYPLRRISVGLMLAIIGFVMSGVLELAIDGASQPNKDGTCPAGQHCINILWQIPQYIVLTFAEVMVSITGLDFAYSQAPESMKSLCQAVWLLMVALGNLLVIVFNVVNPVVIFGVTEHVAFWQTIVYSIVLLLASVLFIWIASRYKYVGTLSHLQRITDPSENHHDMTYQAVNTEVVSIDDQ